MIPLLLAHTIDMTADDHYGRIALLRYFLAALACCISITRSRNFNAPDAGKAHYFEVRERAPMQEAASA